MTFYYYSSIALAVPSATSSSLLSSAFVYEAYIVELSPFWPRSTEEAHQVLYLIPTKSFKSELLAKCQGVQLLLFEFLNNWVRTLAVSKMIKIPPRRNHEWNVIAVSGSDGYFGDVRSEIQDKGMKTCAQSDGGGNSEKYPIGNEVEYVLEGLILKSLPARLPRWRSSAIPRFQAWSEDLAAAESYPTNSLNPWSSGATARNKCLACWKSKFRRWGHPWTSWLNYIQF